VCRLDHPHHLDLVRRGHDDDVGESAEVGKIVAAMVCRPVIPHQPRTVNHEAHRQALNDAVMHHLVIAALEKG
jgi:hypothetical protein